ncbi:hypothetical protein HanIR_Chr12g0595141 [Helianthus annuus]|nr:hypothetical protein HanIR_Chr12g0595141 [Helianthus annuus]
MPVYTLISITRFDMWIVHYHFYTYMLLPKTCILANTSVLNYAFKTCCRFNDDVDDAWNLVGCLDTHFKFCILIVLYFLYPCCCI